MGETRSIFFWMSGVLTQSIPEVLSGALSKSGKTEVDVMALPGFTRLCDQLALGQIDDLSFCKTICELSHVDQEPPALKEKILEAFVPNPSVIQTIDLLPMQYERWLVVDCPESWFERVSERLEIYSAFSGDQLVFLPKSRLARLVPDVFYHLAHLAQISFPEGLLIDASSKRAVQALNHGLPSAIFVNAWRLDREFTLRYFISKSQPVHKPNL